MRAVFVMLKVEPGHLHAVASELADLEIVSELYSVLGDHDLIAKIYVEDFDDLDELVTERIQRVPHLRETKTILTFNAYDLPKRSRP